MLDSVKPYQIVKSLYDEFGFLRYYIADLDSIMNNSPNMDILNSILKSFDQITLILDPGIENKSNLETFSTLPNIKLILGLETINSLDIISDAVDHLGSENVIVSIDLYNGKIFSKNQNIKNFKPLELVNKIQSSSISNIILLDLSRVGQKVGGIPNLYKEIEESFYGNILVGGGIRDIADVRSYRKQNFSGVLIGTALYDGTIKKKEIKSFFNEINQQ
jgi:phosphoribosylformimino-5-aminoimidazole carboxamide ribotide isomerase